MLIYFIIVAFIVFILLSYLMHSRGGLDIATAFAVCIVSLAWPVTLCIVLGWSLLASWVVFVTKSVKFWKG